MILCDTNILIEFFKNSPGVTAELQAIGQANIALSVVSQAELYYGALNKSELAQIQAALSSLHRFPLDVQVSSVFLQLMEQYCLSHRLSLPDALIAATGLVHEVSLYTLRPLNLPPIY